MYVCLYIWAFYRAHLLEPLVSCGHKGISIYVLYEYRFFTYRCVQAKFC